VVDHLTQFVGAVVAVSERREIRRPEFFAETGVVHPPAVPLGHRFGEIVTRETLLEFRPLLSRAVTDGFPVREDVDVGLEVGVGDSVVRAEVVEPIGQKVEVEVLAVVGHQRVGVAVLDERECVGNRLDLVVRASAVERFVLERALGPVVDTDTDRDIRL